MVGRYLPPYRTYTNKLYAMHVAPKIGEGNKPSPVDFKSSLKNVYMKDLETWKNDNLTENLAVKRARKLVS
jgi:hypothetical protein